MRGMRCASASTSLHQWMLRMALGRLHGGTGSTTRRKGIGTGPKLCLISTGLILYGENTVHIKKKFNTLMNNLVKFLSTCYLNLQGFKQRLGKKFKLNLK